MRVFLVIELALLAILLAKVGLADIERELLRRPYPRRYEDTD